MFNPMKASESIKAEFISYVLTSFHIADRDYANQFAAELNQENSVAKGPYLDISDSFEIGKNIESLIEEGELSPLFRDLEKEVPENDKEIKLQRKLYLHQEKAIRKINQEHNLVVTTGTGSGKTECFVLPIINYLLREKQAGTLSRGVRAILIYPMNALANDQMKRLRMILKNYPDITFGVYNSSTKQNDEEGIAEYGRIFKDANGRVLNPLPNEVLSRETMQNTPPHILVTNYAMLEYMMLRPNDDQVFSGAKLKFLILDEAHIYRGATGMETSLLLRRLKARISNPAQVRHILTSATLGGKEADKDIVTFAETLCAAKFQEDDIIRSNTVMPEFPNWMIDYPIRLFSELSNPESSLNEILDAYHVEYDSSLSDAETLFDLCMSSTLYKALRECVTGPMTVKQITSRVNSLMPVTEDDIVNLIHVASRAEKNKMALIKARYHMFVRALEGAYITIGARKSIFLNRSKYTPDGKYRVFEAAVCDDCGRIGIAGKEVHGFFEFAHDRWDKEKEVYLLREQNERWDEQEDDEDDATEQNGCGKNDFLICATCGKILHESRRSEFDCDCDTANRIRVRKAEVKGTRSEHRCPCCNIGHMKLFYLGYDAATAVLGTELFEQLPEHEAVLKSKNKEEQPTGELFSMAIASKPVIETIRKKRQFLSFSDSRSEAAFFACYMTSFYQEFLRRRGIWHVIKENQDSINKNPWEIVTLVDEITSYFDTNRTFADPGDDGKKNLTAVSRHQAWIAVLNEMVGARRSTSLVSMGILDFSYKGNNPQLMTAVANKYGKSIEDVVALFHLLVMDLVYNGALEGEGVNLTDDDREYIYYTASPRRFVKCKQSESERKKNGLSGWIPRRKSNGGSFKNGRVKRTMQVLGISEEEAIDLLSKFWESVLLQSEFSMTHDGGAEYYISTNRFVVKAGSEALPVFVCAKCGKTTMTNCQDKCVSIRCDGKLRRVSHEDLLSDNHFARLYSTEQMRPMHIREHTAQLGRAEQQTYQEMFVNKEINALSCSTTFEMGVDVGDLETVYLRNMPPSPANYVQRAGRAGRSIHSAAYALTYAKLGSHDFTYFDKPERMISGKIGVPLFSISNEKVVLRHIFAVALADFFGHYEEVYNRNDANELLNNDGYEKLVDYIKSRPNELFDILKQSIPVNLHDGMGITDWSWTEKLIGDDGVLKVAVEDFRNTVAWYGKEIFRLKRKNDIQAAAHYERHLKAYRRSPDDKRGRNELIEFLVRNNVLPKYGFPVDTVELYQGTNSPFGKKLQMVRDLQLAIAEYAPDAQVVADGMLYTSRYIRKLPQTTGQDWEEVYIAECKNKFCKTWNYRRTEPSKDGEKCISCHSIIEKARWKKAIEPRKGFIAEPKPTAVPLRKPDRSFKSEDYYIGDPQRQIMTKKTFLIEGSHKIQMETSTNDSLMVVCKDNFFVCDRCGYSISSVSGKNKKDFNSNAKYIEERHKTPWDKDCNGRLYRKDLCHAFKTDVVQIVFGTSRAKNQAVMLSVMYALLEAMSDELDIERTDIKGCLHKVRYENSMVYAIILYDGVAGGAGHVRRLVTEDCGVFQRIVSKAVSLTKNCNCSPSCYRCLRNYYNQAVHNILDRCEAYRFLEAFSGEAIVIPDEDFQEKHSAKPTAEITEDCLRFGDSWPCSYNNWSEFMVMIPDNCKEIFADFDYCHIPLPTEAYCKCKVQGTDYEYEVLLLWEDKKIMVFEDDRQKLDVAGWTSMKVGEIKAKAFINLF
ncbi:hypothetical protein BCS37_00320 [Selenomonas sp. oral taxon 920]|uniref:DEAD/DEAH box helicase n=1 Tax=Selenomonas sp. oral taxon 920 TaxID=1884263 RepID=UPI000840FBC1|nr:DEAD/DEAH box helicase [Selenomonas sp. oral taxon 920]AOH46986.1 hypothetical protein BCS37_00320 [Selenomonas sp. oral taxon 920]